MVGVIMQYLKTLPQGHKRARLRRSDCSAQNTQSSKQNNHNTIMNGICTGVLRVACMSRGPLRLSARLGLTCCGLCIPHRLMHCPSLLLVLIWQVTHLT
jgi:hypothetical protein